MMSSGDYQTGLQRAARGGPSLRSDRRALPAALSAGVAKAFAEHRLSALWNGRVSGKLHLPWKRSGIRPGTHLRIEGQPGLWKVARWSLNRMVVSLEVVRVPAGFIPAAADASPGRPIGHLDQPYGATTLFLLDLPWIDEGTATRPLLLAAAAGASSAWKRAALMTSYDGGVSWQEEGTTAAPAVIGRATSVLAAGGAALIDARNSVDVELLNDAMWLESRGDEGLVAGANLAVLGDELIQFGSVEPIGERRFRLSRLLRGRRGSEWAASTHRMRDAFVLLGRESLAPIDPLPGSVGAELRISAQGIGDGDDAVLASTSIEGRAMQLPSPVHFTASKAGNGDIIFSWARRSRTGWIWLSGSDTPLGEESEAYRLFLSGATFSRATTLGNPFYTYTAAQQAEDGFTGALQAEVTQMGTHASSRSARLSMA